MKSKLLFYLTVSSFLFLSFYSNAQNDFQGVAYYESKTTVDLSNFGRPDMNEERKKQIMDRMKSFLEKTYVLTFNREESLYKEDEKLEAPSGQRGGFGRMMMGSFTAGPQYKNIKNKKLLQDQEFFGKQFLIKDSLSQLEWKMTSETKQIGSYTCFKATAIKKADEVDFRSFRPRGRRQNTEASENTADTTNVDNPVEKEMPKEIVVTAWYTMQIPVSQGPDEFWGLPGLILEVNMDRTTILCSKLVLNPNDKQDIKAPSKGKEVSKEEYNTIVKKKTEEMREQFRGRGGRGRFRG